MRRNLLIIKFFFWTLMFLAVAFSLNLPQSSYAQCVTDSTKFLSTGPSSALIYWVQAPSCDPSDVNSVYYATSFDKLKTWSAPQLLFELNSVREFDGIISGDSTLLAPYAIQETAGPTIYVRVSTDKGKTWSGQQTVHQFEGGSFNDNPTLDSLYNQDLKRFVLRTTITISGITSLYVFSSSNGTSWTLSTIDDFPPYWR